MRKLLVLAALFCTLTVFAQPGGPGGNPDAPPPGAPIDGGVSLLVAGAIGYGVKKVKEARKKKAEGDTLTEKEK